MLSRWLLPGSGSTPKRFLAVYWPGGTVAGKWTPTGTETAFTLSPILSPLEPVKSSILIPDGLYLTAGDGSNDPQGSILRQNVAVAHDGLHRSHRRLFRPQRTRDIPVSNLPG